MEITESVNSTSVQDYFQETGTRTLDKVNKYSVNEKENQFSCHAAQNVSVRTS